jgi:AcrR family transcriptional regulator
MRTVTADETRTEEPGQLEADGGGDEAKAPKVSKAAASVRGRYHHGDLANALTREATAMAREGGPDAIVLREAARRVGVSATAAYRHFAAHENLLFAVKVKAQQALAEAMEQSLAQVPASGSAAEDAIRRGYVFGEAYVKFALSEPGLFRTAFTHDTGIRVHDTQAQTPTPEGEDPTASRQTGPDMEAYRSFQLLSEVLDDLVEAGLLPPERRPNAEFAPWAAMHGLATLFLDGPLDTLPAQQRDVVLRSTLDTIIRGLINSTA